MRCSALQLVQALSVKGDVMYGEINLFGQRHPELADEVAHYLRIPLSGADVFEFPNENIFGPPQTACGGTTLL